MKKYLLKTLKKLIFFLNGRLKVKQQIKSPADLYHEEVARNTYEVFKDHFKNSFVFSTKSSKKLFHSGLLTICLSYLNQSM